MNTPIKRKLAAILAADVAGYSRLMGANEEATLRLLAAHRAIIDSIIGLHDGRVVNTAGDSVLAEFGSPVEAVRAASEIQDALRTRNESLPEDSRMMFRIGVHLGDVMINADDLLGDGVNVAARLQAVAEPGGICISSAIFDQVEGKLSLRFQDIGEQTLKNIARPVRAFRLSSGAATVARPAQARPRRRRRGIVVALVAAGLVALGAGAYLAGLVPDFGRQARQEAAAWDALRGTGDVAALEGYLAAYPASPHAGDARGRIAELLARARGAAEAARGAAEAERARAEVELARLKAGEAEAARVKAEADTTRLKAEAVRIRSEAEAAKARADAEQAAQTSARASTPAPAAPPEPVRSTSVPPNSRDSRFDGLWTGELTCPAWRTSPAFQRPQRLVVQNGEASMEVNPLGRRSVQSTGRVHDDDSVELRGTTTGPGGRTFEHVVRGRFAGDTFTGQAEPPARPCTLQLSRGPRPAR